MDVDTTSSQSEEIDQSTDKKDDLSRIEKGNQRTRKLNAEHPTLPPLKEIPKDASPEQRQQVLDQNEKILDERQQILAQREQSTMQKKPNQKKTKKQVDNSKDKQEPT